MSDLNALTISTVKSLRSASLARRFHWLAVVFLILDFLFSARYVVYPASCASLVSLGCNLGLSAFLHMFGLLHYVIWLSLYCLIVQLLAYRRNPPDWSLLAFLEILPAIPLIVYSVAFSVYLSSVIVYAYPLVLLFAFAAFQYVKAWDILRGGNSKRYTVSKIALALLVILYLVVLLVYHLRYLVYTL